LRNNERESNITPASVFPGKDFFCVSPPQRTTKWVSFSLAKFATRERYGLSGESNYIRNHTPLQHAFGPLITSLVKESTIADKYITIYNLHCKVCRVVDFSNALCAEPKAIEKFTIPV